MGTDVATLFAEPLQDLGDGDASLRGIFMPSSERGAPKQGVTAQFLANAASYHDRYSNEDHFRVLIENALATLDPPIDPEVILDIGSGSGNSVIPLLRRFPNAFVVATDISPQLLAILRDYLAPRPEYRDRYALVCMDASHDCYCGGVFDLAVGAAILHHIIAPEQVIRACERALRPGGVAVFFEPFEAGDAMLQLAYRDIIAEAERRREETAGIAVLKHLYADYRMRTRDKSDPVFLALDDKWMFTRSFFEGFTDSGRWADCRVHPIHDDAAPLANQTRVNLRLVAGVDEYGLPAWAWDTLSQYESAFSNAARRDLIVEAAVVLRLAHEWSEPGSGWWWNPAESGRGFFVELRESRACAACCTYDDGGRPIWFATEATLVTSGSELMADLWPLRFPGSGFTRAIEPAGRLSMQFEGARRAQWTVAGHNVPLQLQHVEATGVGGSTSPALSGWWIEDAEQPGFAIVAEWLGDRVLVALLSQDAWCIAEASQRGARTYEGQWRRFCGGQTIDGPYRPPTSVEDIGQARLTWTDASCVVVKLPDRHNVAFRRLPFGNRGER